MRFLIVFLCFCLSATAWAQSRVALVIGNAAYTHSPLDNPANDALDMAAALSGYGFQVIGYDAQRKQLSTINLDYDGMENAVLQFEQALSQGSIGLFFYAGHGIQDARQQNYLIPVGASIKNVAMVRQEAMSAQWVLDTMESRGTQLNIVVLDACRDNPFRSFFRSSRSGLAEMGTPSGTIITYATHAGGLAADGNGGRNGLYTEQLLAAMQEGGLTIEQIFKQTAQGVQAAAKKINHVQEPWIGMSYTGNFCFGQCLPSRAELMGQLQQLQAQLAQGNQESEVLRRLQALEQQILRDAERARESVVVPEPPKPPVSTSSGSFRDCPHCPEMVWIPATDNFTIGSPSNEKDRYSNEAQKSGLRIGRFAMGKYEVTFAEYDRFAEATGRSKPDDEGWGRGTRPVINVSWHDAVAYTEWLSRETGQAYRLPTEAEWEYAARGGTRTRYWWGDEGPVCRAGARNGAKFDDNANCDDTGTEMVGRYQANPFGLYDVHGNVWEWTCSEYNGSYNGNEKNCVSKNDASRPVLRGGSWYSRPFGVRSAYRNYSTASGRSSYVGFRLARM